MHSKKKCPEGHEMEWMTKPPYYLAPEELVRRRKFWPLTVNLVKEMWRTNCHRTKKANCDICKNQINIPKGLHHCQICRYDECAECSGYNKILEQREKAKKLALGLKLEDGEEGLKIQTDTILESLENKEEAK